jgi:hypothetical protein
VRAEKIFFDNIDQFGGVQIKIVKDSYYRKWTEKITILLYAMRK